MARDMPSVQSPTTRLFARLILAATLAAPVTTVAQTRDRALDPHAGHVMAPDAPVSTARERRPPSEGENGAHMAMGSMRMAGMMGGQLAAYPMTRDASGTAWQPDSSRMDGVMLNLGSGWSGMAHGYGALVYDDQGGPRGATKTFFESMGMVMAQRQVGPGVLTLRAMGSLDPTMGKRGYPLLLQTGETADQKTLLVDRQHPHDLVMELAAVYSRPIARELSGFVYLGWPGEPALGPATFMHRFSGMVSPEAPISHHWLDSTHITFGVAATGLVWRDWKLEGSAFTGREPDESRYDLDHPTFDSGSVRLSWNPNPDWSLQVSRGHLVSPEQLEAEVDQDRTTASATYNRPFTWRGVRGYWQTTGAWGRNEKQPGTTTDAFLLDSAASHDAHSLFARVETVDKDELFANDHASPLHDRVFTVTKASVGYAYTIALPRRLYLDLGGLVSRYDLPPAIRPLYGSDPTSGMVFSRLVLR